MSAYFDLWRRFGWKMWGSFLVGSLAAAIPMVFLIIVAVFGIIAIGVTSVIGAGFDPLADPEDMFTALFSSGTIVVAILFFLFFLIASMLTSAFSYAGAAGVVTEVIQEQRASIGAYFRYGFRRLFPMLGLTVIMFLLAILPAIPAIIGVIFLAIAEGWSVALGIIFVLLTVLAYIVYGLMVMHAPIILIAERKGVFASLGQSFRTFYRRFGQVVLSALILFGISIVGSVITLILEWAIAGVNPFDIYAESDPFRSFLSSILIFPISVGLQLIVMFTLAFRYLHIIQPPPTNGGPNPVLDDPTDSGPDDLQRPPHPNEH